VNSISELELNLDLIELLEHWDVNTCDLHQVGNMSWRSSCWIHGGDGADNLSIRYYNGRWWLYCFSHQCFSGTLVDYGLSIGKTITDIVHDYEMCQGATQRKWNRQREESRSCVLPDNILDKYERAVHIDLIRLGFDRDTLLNVWDVRFCADPTDIFYNRYLWPIRSKIGEIVTLQARCIEGYEQVECKYRFFPGHSAKHVLYGAYEQRERIAKSPYVVVAEGAKAVWRGYDLGIPTLGLLGIRYTEQQVRLLASYNKRLILVADADEPGISGMNELANELRRYVPVEVRVCPLAGTDISDYMTRDEWMRILEV
jgi:hypothetical protein